MPVNEVTLKVIVESRDDKGRPSRIRMPTVERDELKPGMFIVVNGYSYFVLDDGRLTEALNVSTGRFYRKRRDTDPNLPIMKTGFMHDACTVSYGDRFVTGKILLMHPNLAMVDVPGGRALETARTPEAEDGIFHFWDNNAHYVRWRHYDEADREAEIGDSERSWHLCTRVQTLAGNADAGRDFWNDFKLRDGWTWIGVTYEPVDP